MMKFYKKFLGSFKNPYVAITAVALALQFLLLILFYALPDPLGLSLLEMYSGKIIWQVVMAVGAYLTLSAIFALLKSPRALAIFYVVYFFFAIADYEVYRFNHQRLSYSFIRTYFHPSNIVDETTLSTLGGDGIGTVLWVGMIFLVLALGIGFCIAYTRSLRNRNRIDAGVIAEPKICSKKCAFVTIGVGLFLSVFPWLLFLGGVRGETSFPFKIEWRFTLGKYTLTAPVLHIAGLETVEFIKDDYSLTDDLVKDLDAFLPEEFAANRVNEEYPGYRGAQTFEYKAKKPYNIVFIFGESYKGRVLNQMLDGDTVIAPNLWKLAKGRYFVKNDSESVAGGTLWFKNAFSGSYPTVRGTTSTYLGFPSHPNRDVPCFYASNRFKGFQEYLTDYHKMYMTISNPVFDHTLPLVKKFYGDNWRLAESGTEEGAVDSMGMDLAVNLLQEMPLDSSWFLSLNTISTHIPFYSYPSSFAEKPEDAMTRYRNALRYTDAQMGRLFEAVAARPDFDRTVFIILGDHDTPVDSLDYKVPQPLGVAASRIFMGIFSADTNLINGFTVREDVASQLDIGTTVMDLAQVRAPHHFWGYDLLAQERPADQPSLFYSQNAYYLGFRDRELVGGLDNEEVFVGTGGEFALANDSLSFAWKKHAAGASKVVRSLLRNDNMMP